MSRDPATDQLNTYKKSVKIIRLFEEWGKDVDIVIEVIGSLIYFIGSQWKYLNYIAVESQMKFLLKEIARHWQTLTTKEEKEILNNYASEGYRLIVTYFFLGNVILVVYITVPLVPLIFDIIDPLNETRPRAFPYFAEYFIDDQKYYFELTMHGWVVCILSVQIYTTFDTTYVLFVQSSCALFAIVEHRLYKATMIELNDECSNDVKKKNEAVYNEVVQAIMYHKQAMHFVGLIEKCYTMIFFAVIILNTAVLSLAAVDTMLNLEKGNHKQMIRLGLLYCGFSCHLLYNMYPGQKVIESSSHVGEAAFHCAWFNTSWKTKQLIHIIMLRSAVPCTLTAKTLVVLHLENFAFVFKKSLSFVAMIRSMR